METKIEQPDEAKFSVLNQNRNLLQRDAAEY